jgi:hypothetical protein
MAKTRISLWEKVKRIVAHAFELETRLEREEKRQAKLRLEHEQHIAKLIEENHAAILAWNEEKKRLKDELAEIERQRKLQAQWEAEQAEKVRLFKDNRALQERHLWKSTQDIIDAEVVEEVAASEEE